jgi:putative phage-type endonuclease
VSALPIDRASWLNERRSYLGGTDVAAIVGKSKYKTALDIYLEKIGQASDSVSSRKAEAGIALEPFVRKWYADEIGKPIEDGRTIRDKQHPFLGANIDGRFDESTLVEIKTMDFSTREEWGQPGTDEIPLHYYVQCVWYLGITGADRVVVVKCDRGTMELTDYMVEPDKALYDLCRAEAVSFWLDNVAKGIPPKPTDRDGSNLIYLFPERRPEILVADPSTDELASELGDIVRQIKPLEKREKEIKEALKVRIGDASGIETLVGKFTLSRRPGKVSWQKVAAHYNPTPDVIEANTGNPYEQLSTPF